MRCSIFDARQVGAGMSPILTGPPSTPTTLAGEDASAEVTQAVGDQLKSTRATADSWQKGLAGLLTVVTSILLLKGRDSIDEIDHWYAVTAAVALGIAALFGAVAAYKLLDAAYGQPSSQDLTKIRQESLYVWRYERAVEAARKLRTGQLLLLASIAIVGGTVVLTWFAPEPSSSPAYQVRDAQGHCGELAKADNGKYKLTEDDNVVTIIGGLSGLKLVRKCP